MASFEVVLPNLHEIELVIFVTEKCLLPSIAALRDMMLYSRSDCSRYPCHDL